MTYMVRKFSNDEINSIIFDYQNGLRPFELAKKYDRNSGTIIGKLKSLGVYKNSLHRFTDDEINFLKEHYPKGDWQAIQEYMPNVSKESIQIKMSNLGVSMLSYYWSDMDIELLKKYYNQSYGKVNELINLFNGKYTYSAITSKAEKLGLKTRDYWSNEEIIIMQENYHIKSMDEMLKLLPNRNRHSISAKAIDLGLKNVCKYQDWEVQFIIDNWEKMSDVDMANKLNKNCSGLINKRLSLGLSREKETSCYLGLYDYLRKNNIFWKKDSMKNCNFKCVLSGKRFDDIHHIYSFNKIVSEVIELLNIDVSKSMSDFSKKELKTILHTFRNIQSNYPLGVCLTKEIHTLFHNLYGYGNTTEIQWNEFVANYKNNKYKTI